MPSLPMVDIPSAVSYTHLDVYKRQVTACDNDYVSSGIRLQLADSFLEIGYYDFISRISVSYTHLDVYKRQP